MWQNLLIDSEADVNASDAEGITSLMLAGNEGRTEIARMLIENGAKVNWQSKSGSTAIDGSCL